MKQAPPVKKTEPKGTTVERVPRGTRCAECGRTITAFAVLRPDPASPTHYYGQCGYGERVTTRRPSREYVARKRHSEERHSEWCASTCDWCRSSSMTSHCECPTGAPCDCSGGRVPPELQARQEWRPRQEGPLSPIIAAMAEQNRALA
jgi:hypothetical protein